MRKTILFIIFLANNCYSQYKLNLSQKMWYRVESCSYIYNDDDVDYNPENIDDSKNGYLKVIGDYCTSTVGAYKLSNGKYLFLDKLTNICTWQNKIDSNRNLDSIFPNFEKEGFFKKGTTNSTNYSSYYLDFKIPRVGTDTEVTIRNIPIGLMINGTRIISYNYDEGESFVNCNTSVYRLPSIIKKLEDEKTLDFLLHNQIEKITESDLRVINEYIDKEPNSMGIFTSINELIESLKFIKHNYELYLKIEHETITLGWDRNKGEFYIKSKGKTAEFRTFREFLLNSEYWSPSC